MNNYYQDMEGYYHVPIGVLEFISNDMPELDEYGYPIIYQIKKTDITHQLKTIYDCIMFNNKNIVYMPFSHHHLCIFKYPKNNGLYGYYLAGNSHFFIMSNNQLCTNLPNNVSKNDSEKNCQEYLCQHIDNHINICSYNDCFVDENERTCNAYVSEVEDDVFEFLNLKNYKNLWTRTHNENFPIDTLFHATRQLYRQYREFIHYEIKLFANISFYFFIYASNRISNSTQLVDYLFLNNQNYFFDNNSDSYDILDPESFIKLIKILFSEMPLKSTVVLNNFKSIEDIYNSKRDMTPQIGTIYEKLKDNSDLLNNYEENDISNLFMLRDIKHVIRNSPGLLEPDPVVINEIIDFMEL